MAACSGRHTSLVVGTGQNADSWVWVLLAGSILCCSGHHLELGVSGDCLQRPLVSLPLWGRGTASAVDEVVVGTGQHTVKGYGPSVPTFAGLGRALGNVYFRARRK